MSDTHEDDERTDPSIALPRESERPRIGGEAGPSTIPPSSRFSSLPPLPPRTSSRPPLPPLPPRAASARPAAWPPNKPDERPPSMRPPPIRPGSIPPPSIPKPSDPPRSDGTFLDRQRIAQLEAQLARAEKLATEQRNDIDELRARIVSSAAALEERLALVEETARIDAIEERLRELEARPLVAPQARDEDEERPDPIGGIEERLRALEEGTSEARIRMRLDRTGLRVDELERRLVAIEESGRAASALVERIEAKNAAYDERLSRIESLFDELAEELRAEREAIDLEGVRARLDDLERLVLQTGTDEQALRRKLIEQEHALATLKESMVPPAPQGDDLTRIKGIGPKYARMLGDMGITTFAQIAAWTDEDIAMAAAHLGVPAGRITKAGWVEAAAKLAE